MASRSGAAQVSHSTHLLSDITEVLQEAGVGLREVELYAVAIGPGSFTGLRIGIATAKAFAMTRARPCIGVPTLHAVAHAAGPSRATVAVLPAGRGEVFAQLLSVELDAGVQELSAPAHLTPQRLLASVRKIPHLKWAGEGAQLLQEMVASDARQHGIPFQVESEPEGEVSAHEQGLWLLSPPAQDLARSIAALALLRYGGGGTWHPNDLQAIYVRPSDAELNDRCHEQNLPAK